MISIKKIKKEHNKYKFEAQFTYGQILAIEKALELYSKQSAVANDVYIQLKHSVIGEIQKKESNIE